MVFARYITRDGKKYGPYYYRTFRDPKTGKVRNVYVGKSLPTPKRSAQEHAQPERPHPGYEAPIRLPATLLLVAGILILGILAFQFGGPLFFGKAGPDVLRDENGAFLGVRATDDARIDIGVAVVRRGDGRAVLEFTQAGGGPTGGAVTATVQDGQVLVSDPAILNGSPVRVEVPLVDGIIARTEVTIGDERFVIGKVIPAVSFADAQGAEGGRRFIDRPDEKIDLALSHNEASAVIRGLAEVPAVDARVADIAGLATPAFAADVATLEDATITLAKRGDVDAIAECPSFDLASGACPGGWTRTALSFTDDGAAITFTVTHFSGYAGIDVLTIQSYPMVGGNWTVAFNTTGTADLDIRGYNGTQFGVDLEFLLLKCGASAVPADYDGTRVLAAGYSCDNTTSYEAGRVLTPGKHTLAFTFGNETEYAHNDAINTINPLACVNLTHWNAAGDAFQYGAKTRCSNITASDDINITVASDSGAPLANITINYTNATQPLFNESDIITGFCVVTAVSSADTSISPRGMNISWWNHTAQAYLGASITTAFTTSESNVSFCQAANLTAAEGNNFQLFYKFEGDAAGDDIWLIDAISLNMTYLAFGRTDVNLTTNATAASTEENVNAFLDFTVHNNGTGTGDYTLLVNNSQSAAVATLNESSFSLVTGGTRRIRLNVTDESFGTYNVTVNATVRGITRMLVFSANVTQPGVNVTANATAATVSPAGNASYEIRVHNNGTTDNTYALRANASGGATATLNVSALSVPRGEIRTALLLVNHSAEGAYTVGVNATDQDTALVTGRVITTTTVSAGMPNVNLTANATAARAKENLLARYTLTVHNNGTGIGTFSLSVNNSQSAAVAVLNDTSFSLAAGASRTVQLNVTDESFGIYTVGVNATADGFVRLLVFSTNISQPGANTTANASTANISRTTNASYLISVHNNGTTDSTYELRVNASGGITAVLNASTLTVPRGAIRTALLSVNHTVNGTYTVGVNATDVETALATSRVITTTLVQNRTEVNPLPCINLTHFNTPASSAVYAASDRCANITAADNLELIIIANNIAPFANITINYSSPLSPNIPADGTVLAFCVVTEVNGSDTQPNKMNISYWDQPTGKYVEANVTNLLATATERNHSFCKTGLGISSDSANRHFRLLYIFEGGKNNPDTVWSLDYVRVNLTVGVPAAGLNLTVNATTATVDPGMNASYEVRVHNNGTTNGTYTLRANASGGMTATLNVSTLTIPAGEVRTALLLLNHSINNTYTVGVNASEPTAGLLANIITTTTVGGGGKVTGLPAGMRAVRADDPGIRVNDTPQNGFVEVLFGPIGGPFAGKATVDFGTDVNVTGIIATATATGAAAILANTSGIAAFTNRTLLIPEVNGSGVVQVCPDAITYSQINSSCPGGFSISVGQSVNGTSMGREIFNGTEYYAIFNITGTGGTEFNISGADNISDSTLDEQHPTQNNGKDVHLIVGKSSSGWRHRAIIKFNITVPAGFNVTEARIKLRHDSNVFGQGNEDKNHSIHRVLQSPPRPWLEDTVTWNNYDTGLPWTSTGGDFNATPTDVLFHVPPDVGSFKEWNVTRDVLDFVANPSLNFGWVVKDFDEVGTGRGIAYSSGESGGATQPILQLTLKDLIGPNITNLGCTPSPFANISQQFQHNVSITDNGALDRVTASVTLPNGTVQAKSPTNQSSTWSFIQAETSIGGLYNVTWTANDTSNNIVTLTTNCTVGDFVAPLCRNAIAVPPSPAIYHSAASYDFFADCTDNGAIGQILFNMRRANGTVAGVLLPSDERNYTITGGGVYRELGTTFHVIEHGLPQGTYNITWLAFDTASNFNTTSFTYTILSGALNNPLSLRSEPVRPVFGDQVVFIAQVDFTGVAWEAGIIRSLNLTVSSVSPAGTSLLFTTQNRTAFNNGTYAFYLNSTQLGTGAFLGVARLVTNESVPQVWEASAPLFVQELPPLRLDASATFFSDRETISVDTLFLKSNGDPISGGTCRVSIADDRQVTVVTNATMREISIAAVPHYIYNVTNITMITDLSTAFGHYVGHIACNSTTHGLPQSVYAQVAFQVKNLTIELLIDELRQTRDLLAGMLARSSEFDQEAIFLITDSFNTVSKVIEDLESGELSEAEARELIAGIKDSIEPLLTGRAVTERRLTVSDTAYIGIILLSLLAIAIALTIRFRPDLIPPAVRALFGRRPGPREPEPREPRPRPSWPVERQPPAKEPATPTEPPAGPARPEPREPEPGRKKPAGHSHEGESLAERLEEESK